MKKLLAGCLMALMLGSAWGCQAIVADPGSAGPGYNPPLLFMLILKADAFLCTPCLDRILAGLSGLLRKPERPAFWSVVLYSPPPAGTDEGTYRSLVTRRAESVIRAIGLEGPLVIDEAVAWKEAFPREAALLVLDRRTRSVHRFSVPLPPEARAFLNRILNEGGDHDSDRDHP